MTRKGGRAWRELRARVLAEDGPWCHVCRRRPATTVDHIVALVLGGAEMDRSNLRPACAACNYSAGARLGNQLRGQRRAVAKQQPFHPRWCGNADGYGGCLCTRASPLVW